ncbi:MAG: ribbon-helix-helix domain-containing protein [Planctomycetes bacterium]|nr:ribbon-helix-helix domain-containing protein [Planctomycetota bacterium]
MNFVRRQVQLTKDQHEALKRESSRTGVSVSGLVREAVDELLSRRRGYDRKEIERIRSFVGAFRDPRADVSERTSEYLHGKARRG